MIENDELENYSPVTVDDVDTPLSHCSSGIIHENRSISDIYRIGKSLRKRAYSNVKVA